MEHGDHERPSTKSWTKGVSLIKQAVADKCEQLSKPVKRWQMWSHTYMDALTLQSSTKAELEDSAKKCAAVEKKCIKHLQAMQEIYETELIEMKEAFKNQMAAEELRCLQEISKTEQRSKEQLLEREKMFKEALSKKDERTREQFLLNEERVKRKLSYELDKISEERAAYAEEMKMQLCLLEEIFKEQLSNKFLKINQERIEHEELMKRQISDKEEILRNTMAELSQLKRFSMELEEMLEEKEMARLELEEASNQKIWDLKEEILKLKVSRWRLLLADFR